MVQVMIQYIHWRKKIVLRFSISMLCWIFIEKNNLQMEVADEVICV